MANVADKQEKKQEKKKGFFSKVSAFFGRIARAFKDMPAEMKKVTWPTRKQLVNYSLVVLAFMVVMGVIIGIIDAGSGWVVSLLVGT
jgi:preprotein translocase subunit SecE